MRKHVIWMLVASVLFPQGAVAQNAYFGAAFGATNYSEEGFDESDSGFKFFAGVRINENFAIEGGYMDFGQQEGSFYGSSASVEVEGFGLAAVGILPLSNEFDLFGKVGLLGWNADVRVGPFSDSDDGSDLLFGFGAAYHLSEQFSLRAEWEFVDLDGSDLDMLSIGAQLDF